IGQVLEAVARAIQAEKPTSGRELLSRQEMWQFLIFEREVAGQFLAKERVIMIHEVWKADAAAVPILGLDELRDRIDKTHAAFLERFGAAAKLKDKQQKEKAVRQAGFLIDGLVMLSSNAKPFLDADASANAERRKMGRASVLLGYKAIHYSGRELAV